MYCLSVGPLLLSVKMDQACQCVSIQSRICPNPPTLWERCGVCQESGCIGRDRLLPWSAARGRVGGVTVADVIVTLTLLMTVASREYPARGHVRRKRHRQYFQVNLMCLWSVRRRPVSLRYMAYCLPSEEQGGQTRSCAEGQSHK